jgi:hypothetical protein
VVTILHDVRVISSPEEKIFFRAQVMARPEKAIT